MQNKLGVLDYGDSRGYPFNVLFGGGVKEIDRPKDLTSDIGALVFWGGTDIYPGFYNQLPNSYNQNRTGTPSIRDSIEWTLMKLAVDRGIPIIGVCRGAQMLCAKAGGSLIQHADNHVGVASHKLETIDGKGNLFANTCHHQMMFLPEDGAELIAWTTGLSTKYIGERDQQIQELEGKVFKEPEIVVFNKLNNSIGIQGHPEWMEKGSSFVEYCLELIREKVIK